MIPCSTVETIIIHQWKSWFLTICFMHLDKMHINNNKIMTFPTLLRIDCYSSLNIIDHYTHYHVHMYKSWCILSLEDTIQNVFSNSQYLQMRDWIQLYLCTVTSPVFSFQVTSHSRFTSPWPFSLWYSSLLLFVTYI